MKCWKTCGRTLFFILFLIGCGKHEKPAVTPAHEFTKNIRTTEARSPEEEKAGFVLPEGFDIEVFASEPDIGKPLNMSFDAKGRMWLTQSNEYPFPNEKGKDRISILEDTDRDGRADKFTTFADSLNIPIGVTPYKNGAIAFSIPHIYYFEDRDGDDKADERKILLKGFGYVDTHGMINNFLRGLDGWIHADHGYRNSSRVTGTGSDDTLYMTSGNTFRFLPDGSQVELTTTGRVNPFGLTYDDLGYMYGVDCHSSPIYQLIRGGDYPHFGKKPSGIGYAPFMMRHEYGSTALAGLELYVAPHFPEAFQENFYYGDVVMSRVLRSSMHMNGTTPVPKQETDFIISADPWFRPVDVKLGPDGALYVADFYNRIIGHYEVPLDHPGRDRQRGRIWRITYSGNEEQETRDWTKANLDELLAGLGDPNRTVRMLAADQLVDRLGSTAREPLLNLVSSPEVKPAQKRHALWVLHRLQALPETVLTDAVSNDDLSVRVHALNIIFESGSVSDQLLKQVRSFLNDPDPNIVRMAAMILSKHPAPEHLADLIALRKTVPAEDSHLVYSVRQSLRDHLRDNNIMRSVNTETWNEADSRILADVLMGVDSDLAALFLLKHIAKYGEDEEQFVQYSRHIARYLPGEKIDELVAMCLRQAGGDLDLQFTLFTSLQEGLARRGAAMSAKAKQWGTGLAGGFLNLPNSNWRSVPFQDLPYPENPWRIIDYSPEEGDIPVRVLTSDPEGVQTGMNHSPEFIIPERLGFYVVGSKKEPLEGEAPAAVTNKVQLRLSDTDEVIAEEGINNASFSKEVQWSLKPWAGRTGHLVVLDGSATRREYVGIGGIAPPVVNIPSGDPDQTIRRQLFACRIARDFRVSGFAAALNKLALNMHADVLVRAGSVEALLAIDPDRGITVAQAIMRSPNEHNLLRERVLRNVGALTIPKATRLLASMIPGAAYPMQKEIAMALARTSQGAELLFQAARRQELRPGMLLDPKVREQLARSMSPLQQNAFVSLTKDVKPPDEELQAVIEKRLAAYTSDNTSIDEGMRVFNQNCLACHEVKEQGGNIGPQLDGIGSWGGRALTEKIMDPNRNISKAFINYTITLKDGTSQTGLLRREEGNVIVFANAAGQEFTVSKDNIVEKNATPFTLMPDRFAAALTQEDYNALLTYLLSLK